MPLKLIARDDRIQGAPGRCPGVRCDIEFAIAPGLELPKWPRGRMKLGTEPVAARDFPRDLRLVHGVGPARSPLKPFARNSQSCTVNRQKAATHAPKADILDPAALLQFCERSPGSKSQKPYVGKIRKSEFRKLRNRSENPDGCMIQKAASSRTAGFWNLWASVIRG